MDIYYNLSTKVNILNVYMFISESYINKYWHRSFPMLIIILVMVRFNLIYRETLFRDTSRLTNKSAIEIITIGHTANKAYV